MNKVVWKFKNSIIFLYMVNYCHYNKLENKSFIIEFK